MCDMAGLQKQIRTERYDKILSVYGRRQVVERRKNQHFEIFPYLRYSSLNVSLFSSRQSNNGVSPDRLIFNSVSVIASDYKFKDVLIQDHRLYMYKTTHTSQEMVFSFKDCTWQAILLRRLIETAPPVTDRVNRVNNVKRLTFCVIANRN